MGYNSKGQKKLDMTEGLTLPHMRTQHKVVVPISFQSQTAQILNRVPP